MDGVDPEGGGLVVALAQLLQLFGVQGGVPAGTGFLARLVRLARDTETVYHKQMRPVVVGGAEVMDSLFPRRTPMLTAADQCVFVSRCPDAAPRGPLCGLIR